MRWLDKIIFSRVDLLTGYSVRNIDGLAQWRYMHPCIAQFGIHFVFVSKQPSSLIVSNPIPLFPVHSFDRIDSIDRTEYER